MKPTQCRVVYKFEATFRACRMTHRQREITAKCHSCCPLRQFINGYTMVCCPLGLMLTDLSTKKAPGSLFTFGNGVFSSTLMHSVSLGYWGPLDKRHLLQVDWCWHPISQVSVAYKSINLRVLLSFCMLTCVASRVFLSINPEGTHPGD